jgi:hypothetical protein
MKTRSEQIDELQEQMFKLKEEDKKEVQAQILPFIKDGKATCHFEGFMSTIITTTRNEDREELIRLIEGKQDSGWYHMGCPISNTSSIRFDDGVIKIYFNFSGKTSELRGKFINEIRTLGIKVNFDEYKSKLEQEIEKAKNKLSDVLKLEWELYHE